MRELVWKGAILLSGQAGVGCSCGEKYGESLKWIKCGEKGSYRVANNKKGAKTIILTP
jgi:hypothetical protein